MAYVICRESARSEELLLERENAEQPGNVPPHSLEPAFAPRPRLRGYQINHRYAQFLQLSREPQVEIRAVCQDGKVRAVLPGGPNQFPELLVNTWNVSDDLNEANDGQVCRIYYCPDSG